MTHSITKPLKKCDLFNIYVGFCREMHKKSNKALSKEQNTQLNISFLRIVGDHGKGFLSFYLP